MPPPPDPLTVLCIGNLYPPAASGIYERLWAASVAALRYTQQTFLRRVIQAQGHALRAV